MFSFSVLLTNDEKNRLAEVINGIILSECYKDEDRASLMETVEQLPNAPRGIHFIDNL